VPAAPIPGRADPAAIWTGNELLVWGGWGHGSSVFADGAAYDPARRAWRLLRAAPLSARAPAVWVWTGKEFLVWGDTSRTRTVRDGAAYNPATDSWRRLPPAPLALNRANAVWVAGEMLVFGAQLDNGNHSRTRYAQGMAYTPGTNGWHLLPASSLSPQASTISVVGGTIVAWDYELRAARYSPRSNRWLHLPSLPLEAAECGPTSASVGRRVVGWYCQKGAIFEPGSQRWRPLRLPEPTLVFDQPIAAGPRVLFLGALNGNWHDELWAYSPR
jgi:hypothetical protein